MLTVLVLLPSIFWAANADTGIFLLAGRTIANGGMPYRDIWDIKPPLIYLLYAIPNLFTSDIRVAWWLASCQNALATAITALLCARWARSLTIGLDTSLCVLWYVVLSLTLSMNGVGQAETWANLFVLTVLNLWFGPRGEKPRASWLFGEGRQVLHARDFLAGLGLGIIVLLKPGCVLPPLACYLALWWNKRQEGCSPETPEAVGQMAVSSVAIPWRWFWAAMGAALPGLLVGYWVWAGGAYPAFQEIKEGFLKSYLLTPFRAGNWSARRFIMLGVLILTSYSLPTLLAAMGMQNRTYWRKGAKAVMVAGVLAGLLALFSQPRTIYYHYQVWQPFACVLITVGCHGLVQALHAKGAIRQLLMYGTALAWHLGVHAVTYGDLVRVPWSNTLRQFQLAQMGRSQPGRDPNVVEKDFRYLEGHAAPGDNLVVFAHQANFNVMAGLPNGTRFVHNCALIVPFTPRSWRAQFVEQLRAQPPRFLMVARGDDNEWLGAVVPPGQESTESLAMMKAWRELNRFVTAHYRVVQESPYMRLYENTGG